MKKFITISILYISIISCSTTQKVSSSNSEMEYWSKEPNLEKVTYEGGDGKSLENIIIVKNAENERNGVAAEYAYIAKQYGVKFVDWKPIGQSTITENNRKIDLIKIQTITSNEIVSFYFDITEFYGKF